MIILQQTRGNLSSGDQLSLDLPFAQTKSINARIGPTPTFTRASSATFVGSNGLIQSAAINTPRFDHTSAGVCRGLLIEESRTNLTVRSDDFGASEWNQQGNTRNLTISANNTASPSGATDADLLTVGATTTTYQVVQRLPAVSGTVTSGTAYTVSCYFKPNQVTRVSIWAGNAVTLPADAIFDLTGSGSVVLATAGTASIQQVGNGWYRCIITGTAGATSDTTLRIGPASGSSRTYAGNSVDSFWAWGAQLEAGSFATSYIPTTTGSVVRSADVCSITGANFTSFYNQSEGTLFADVTPQSIAQLATVLAVNSGSAQNQHGIYKTNAAFQAAGLRWGATSVLTGFVTQAAPSTGTDVAISRSKLSYAYKLDDFSFAYAGTIVGIDTSGTLPSPTTMQIGNRDGTLQINGHLAAIRFYKKRLPNAKLQSLTA